MGDLGRRAVSARLHGLVKEDASVDEVVEAVEEAVVRTFGSGARAHRDIHVVSDVPARDGFRHLTVDVRVLPLEKDVTPAP